MAWQCSTYRGEGHRAVERRQAPTMPDGQGQQIHVGQLTWPKDAAPIEQCSSSKEMSSGQKAWSVAVVCLARNVVRERDRHWMRI